MSIIRWNPWDDVSVMQGRINRLFDNAFPGQKQDQPASPQSEWNPVVDVFDTDDAVIIHAELPGLSKEDISIEVKGDVLTLKGEKCECTYIDGDSCWQRERCFGIFERDFKLPAIIDFEKIRASYTNGVLELTIPKPKPETPRRVTVATA